MLSFLGVLLETLSFGAIVPVVLVVMGDNTPLDMFGIQFSLPDGPRTIVTALALTSLVLVLVIKHLLILWISWIQSGVFAGLSVRLSTSLFQNYLLRPYVFHTDHSSSELITNTQNSNLVVTGIIVPMMALISDGFLGFSALMLLIYLEPLGTALAILVMGTFSWAFYRLTRRAITSWGAAQVELRRAGMKLLQDGYGGVKELKILGRESSVVRRYRATQESMQRANRRFGVVQSTPRMVLEIMAVAGLAILAVGQTLRGRSANEVVPVLAVFAAASFRVVPAASRFTTSMQQLRHARPMIRILAPDLRLHARETAKQAEPVSFKVLEFRSVKFCHASREQVVLNGTDLRLSRGESLGIMGESGSGKSTLVEVALGLFKPQAGEVLLNDMPIDECLTSWHQIVGYVPQTVFLADGTLCENVALGFDERLINRQAVERALEIAQLSHFVGELNEGMNTLVGERGIRLSGGQRQRIGIARALYHQPEVLIFDEATSSLDAETEAAFLADIRQLKGHFTMLFIAHRTSTLGDCDRILKLENGLLSQIDSY